MSDPPPDRITGGYQKEQEPQETGDCLTTDEAEAAFEKLSRIRQQIQRLLPSTTPVSVPRTSQSLVIEPNCGW